MKTKPACERACVLECGSPLPLWGWCAITLAILAITFPCSATKVPWSQVPYAVQTEATHFVDVQPFAETHLEKGDTVYHFSGNKNNKHNEVDLSSAGKFIRLEQHLGLNLCPKPVQNAIRPYTTGGKLEKVTRHADNETSSFEAEITFKNDMSLFVEVDKNGKLLSTETEVAITQVPAAVQKTIKAELNIQPPTYIGRLIEDGDTSFHVEVEAIERTNEFWVANNGRLLERELMFVECPGAVQKAILPRMGKSPDVKITKDCETGDCRYTVEFIGSKDEHELTVDISGKVVSESNSVPLDQTPEPVQKLVKEKTAGATVASVTKTQEGDQLYYEIEVTRDGKDESFDVSPEGKILD
jgi:uncharacterized membrane protein YkoI